MSTLGIVKDLGLKKTLYELANSNCVTIASLYTVPLTAINGLSRLTKFTSRKRQARPIRFENF